MAMRAAASRRAAHSLRPVSLATPASRRGLAAPASGSFQYQTGEAAGVKYAARDLSGPATTVALVSKAGTRYQPIPGIAEALEKFAFRNTYKRSALRLQREAELFGATYFSHHSRESIVLGAKCFRDDLPYFVEVLNEVATDTKYINHEYLEGVTDQIMHAQDAVLLNPNRLAIESAHGLAFHRGLGEPLHPASNTALDQYLSADAIGAYSSIAYSKPNIAIVSNGADASELGKWVGEFFKDMRSTPAEGLSTLEKKQTKYYGGEDRIAHSGGNSLVLAFPGSSSLTGGFFKPEIEVLAKILGGKSSIKWSPGFSLLSNVAGKYPGLEINTRSDIYSDAGLLTISFNGPAASIHKAAVETIQIIKDIGSGKLENEIFKKAVANAKFSELEYGQELLAGLELTGSGLVQDGKPYQIDEAAQKVGEVKIDAVKKAAKDILAYKACVATVGDLFQLPYAEELGLQV